MLLFGNVINPLSNVPSVPTSLKEPLINSNSPSTRIKFEQIISVVFETGVIATLMLPDDTVTESMFELFPDPLIDDRRLVIFYWGPQVRR